MAAFDPETEKKLRESVDVLKSVAPNIKAVEKGSDALFRTYEQPKSPGQNLDQKLEDAAKRASRDADRASELITKDNFNR